uniref:DRBM domain-containing protein n=1 Tax=Quercus lobata TaxID=97700 RepID=A0A7N2M3J4_QUELO
MYKSKLQELCQQKSWSLPEYVSTKDGPDHNPRFTATATVIINSNSPPQTFHSSNPCKSSKEAQNDAARVAFLHFTQPPPPPPPSITIRPNSSFASFPQPSLPSSSSFSGSTNGSTDLDIVSATRQAMQPKTQEIYQTPQVIGTTLHVNNDFRDMQHFYKNQLQNFAQKRNLLLPVYSCKCEGPPHASHFRCKVTVDGQTYESPELFTTLKDAEHAAAKIALTSLVPDGAKEDNSGLYKNLLQELVQKEGFSLPVYNTNRFGEVHVPIFVSTVEIEGEVFKGHEERTKKQAEMNAAKIAYTTLKEQDQIFKPTKDSNPKTHNQVSKSLATTKTKRREIRVLQSCHTTTNKQPRSNLVESFHDSCYACHHHHLHLREPPLRLVLTITSVPRRHDFPMSRRYNLINLHRSDLKRQPTSLV